MLASSNTPWPLPNCAGLTVGDSGTIWRLLPLRISALACRTPCSSVEQRCTRTMVAIVNGGAMNCSSCAFALRSSSVARVSALASAWLRCRSWSFSCAATASGSLDCEAASVCFSCPIPTFVQSECSVCHCNARPRKGKRVRAGEHEPELTSAPNAHRQSTHGIASSDVRVSDCEPTATQRTPASAQTPR